MDSPATLSVAGLFAGIGGLERGLGLAGVHAELLCEWWEPASKVLAHHWPDVSRHGDVRSLKSLPKTDVVTAGFPCTDLSQAGLMAGIRGANSGLVGEVFRLIKRSKPTWLVLENVRNMLSLDSGRAMSFLVSELESLGYRWAYRVVDSRSVGLPQRRQRVILVASRDQDPSAVLFADDMPEPPPAVFSDAAFGFYWTEGLKGLGWARDAVPTLKGGSTVGIPSPPAIWVREAPFGCQLVLPSIEEAEKMQGFPAGWTSPSQDDERRNGPRWKLVGNAVSVGVSAWLGARLVQPGDCVLEATPIKDSAKWPLAAYGGRGSRWRVPATMWPVSRPYQHLLDVVDTKNARPLSARATAGFLNRTEKSTLRFDPEFLVAAKEHLRAMSSA